MTETSLNSKFCEYFVHPDDYKEPFWKARYSITLVFAAILIFMPVCVIGLYIWRYIV